MKFTIKAALVATRKFVLAAHYDVSITSQLAKNINSHILWKYFK